MVQIKGSVLLDSITGIQRRDGERGLEEIIAMLDGDTKKMFQTTVSASTWYPLDLFVRFLAVELKKSAGGNEEVLVTRAEKLVERQLRGVYKIFIKFGSPEFLMKRLTAVNITYFTGVQADVQVTGPGKLTIRFTGFEKQHRLMGFALIGFFRKALELSGSANRQVRFTTPIEAGEKFAEMLVSWS
jgi:hypothetical protein